MPILFSSKRLALCAVREHTHTQRERGKEKDTRSTLSPISIDRIKFRRCNCTSYMHRTRIARIDVVRARGSDWIHVRGTISVRAREER